MPGKKRKAFTLIELLVVVAIFAVLAASDLIDYRNSSRTQRLQRAADEMVERIKQAQGLAYANEKQMICTTDNLVCMSGSACDAAYPTNCINQYVSRYGIRFDTDGTKKKYMIGADYSGIGNFVTGESIPNGIVVLPSDITINSVTPAQVAGAYDLSYVYDSSNASPFITCSSNCVTTIVLKDNVANVTKTVIVQKRTGIASDY